MNQELRTQVDAAQGNMAVVAPGYSYESSLHRLEDLIDIAARHGVDATPWVDPAILRALAEA